MIESYAFVAMFAVQILAMSVLLPDRFIKYARAQAASFPAERFAQRYPGVDHSKILERYFTWYRVLNTGIAVLGLPLLSWLFSYMQRPDWDDGPVEVLGNVYVMAQVLPLLLVAWIGIKYRMVLEHLLEVKRTAVLQRRGLFDFVSPFVVFVAVLSYFLFIAYVLYVAQHPFPGFAGPFINIGGITLFYALIAFHVYRRLYGKKRNLFEAHADRIYTIGLKVKAAVYFCIYGVVALSLSFTRALLDLDKWDPLAQSVHFVIAALFVFMVLAQPPRRPKADALGSSPV